MSFFEFEAVKVWFTESEIKVLLNDGREAGLLLSKFPLLKNATDQQKSNVEIVKGYALYWPDLGEDLSIAGFFENELHSKPLVNL